MSHIDKSKLNAEIPKAMASSLIENFLLISKQVLSALLCDISTPFGFPVEPEVNIM